MEKDGSPESEALALGALLAPPEDRTLAALRPPGCLYLEVLYLRVSQCLLAPLMG